jgi:hypothetical protein
MSPGNFPSHGIYFDNRNNKPIATMMIPNIIRIFPMEVRSNILGYSINLLALSSRTSWQHVLLFFANLNLYASVRA